MKRAACPTLMLLALAVQGCSIFRHPITAHTTAPEKPAVVEAAASSASDPEPPAPTVRPARGYFQSTGTAALAKMCVTMRARDEANFCSGFILAAFDLLALQGAICPPVKASNVQLIAIGRRSLQGRQGQRKRLASEHMRQVFSKAFPCR